MERKPRQPTLRIGALALLAIAAGVLLWLSGRSDAPSSRFAPDSANRTRGPEEVPAPTTPGSAADTEPASAPGQEDVAPLLGTLQGRIVREGEAPAAGIGLRVADDTRALDSTVSDEEGRFRIRYPKSSPWTLMVHCSFAEIEGLEGVEDYDTLRNIYRVPAPSRPLLFRVTSFKDMSHLRCVDARTGTVLLQPIRMEFACRPEGPFEAHSESWPTEGGWDSVLHNYLPYPVKLPVSPEDAEVRISVPGYAPVTRHNRDLRGWVSVPLEPMTADVTGNIVLAPEFDGAEVRSELRSDGDGAPPLPREFRGLPESGGVFHLHGVPEQKYTLRIRAKLGERLLQVERSFEKRAGPLDLGAIRMDVGARMRVRVVDGGGKLVTQSRVLLREVGGAAASPGRLAKPDSWDEEGWIEFADLRPGARYVVAASGAEPAPSREFAAPSTVGALQSIELAYAEHLVFCRVHVLFEGAQSSLEWAADRGAEVPLVWTTPEGAYGPSLFVGDLLPGTYRIRVQEDTRVTDSRAVPVVLEGQFTVRSGEPLDTTLDLLRTAASPAAR
jgi:hypothetical protein